MGFFYAHDVELAALIPGMRSLNLFRIEVIHYRDEGDPSGPRNCQRTLVIQGLSYLFGNNFYGLRYEDLLEHPFNELKKVWEFLGVIAKPALEKSILVEMSSNPDEEWQAERLKELGARKTQARHAAEGGADWHDVDDLMRRGCSLSLALKILKPLEEPFLQTKETHAGD